MDIYGRGVFSADLFKNPTAEFYPSLAWVWNAPLDRAEIVRQLDELAGYGVKALYVLPEPKEFRPGKQNTFLSPDYMSDGFMELFRFAAERAKKNGMAMWLYDEGGWPSGGACGLVLKKYPNASARRLALRRLVLKAGEKFAPEDGVLAAFAGERRIFAGFSPEADAAIDVYFAEKLRPNLNFVNLLDPKATEAFIETTYERYREYVGEEFGGLIKLIFTDEPNLSMPAWTEGLERLFADEYGYDVLDFLPAVFSPGARGEGARKARVDYHMLVARLFRSSFFEPIKKWCGENGILFGGHLNVEHTPEGPVRNGYGSVVGMLGEMDVPGIDTIWRQIFPYKTGSPVPEGSVFFPRTAASAAHQRGTRLALSETFSVYGEGMTPDEMRYAVNFQLARGINVFNFMSVSYGKDCGMAFCMRPSFCPEKPGFDALRALSEYTARAETVMQTGDRVCDTALYYPRTDLILGGETGRTAAESYNRLGAELEESLIDFDIIDDEAVLSAEKTGFSLKIGGAEYRHVVIPDCANIPDGVSAAIRPLEGRGKPLARCENRSVRVSAARAGDDTLYFVFDQGTEPVDASIIFPCGKPCYRLDAESGNIFASGGAEQRLRLESGEAAIYLFTDKAPAALEGREEALLLLREPKLVDARRFSVEDGRMVWRGETLTSVPDADFSGEIALEYDYEFPAQPAADDLLRLTFADAGYALRVYIDGQLAGICGAAPQSVCAAGAAFRKSGKIRVVLSTSSADAIIAGSEGLMRDFSDVVGLYHREALKFEKDSGQRVFSPEARMTRLS